MELKASELLPRYRSILDRCEPYIISYPANWPALDLAPFGVAVAPARRFTATTLASRDVVDGLHHLDAATFGDQDMLMPRWVLFDCGEFPGLVFGFGTTADQLPAEARAAYHVVDRDDAFVPLSMWVAIRCAEDRAWFGHNLSSANVLLPAEHAIPGLATLTKVLGVRATRATRQYGATQWDSASVGLHLQLGAMHVLSAYTPAHTHPATLAYRIDVDPERLLGCLCGRQEATPASDRVLAADDEGAIRALHDEIEGGAGWQLVRVERREGASQLLHLREA